MEITNDNIIRRRKKRIIINLMIDLMAMFFSTLTLTLINPQTEKYINNYYIPQTVFFILFVIVSVLFQKYELRKKRGFYFVLNRFILSWLISSLIFLIVIYFFDIQLSFKLIIYWLLCVFFFELIFYIIGYTFRHAQDIRDAHEYKHKTFVLNSILEESNEVEPAYDELIVNNPDLIEDIPDSLNIIHNENVRYFIHKYSFFKQNKRLLLSTHNRFNIQSYACDKLDQIVNIRKINHISYINKFFETVFTKLKHGGIYILCVETLEIRKKRIQKQFSLPLSWIIRLFDYFIHRIWPRLPYLRKIYFLIWKNTNKRISYAETLGRLYSCGFEYLAEMVSGENLWLAVQKKNQPVFDFNATYGPLIKLRRIGKEGKVFNVYKFRTMHPFSEFLQDFVYRKNALEKGGKFKNDFRITTIGKFMRKTWLDELPMLFNLLRGDIKLVGVRPLSKHFFSLYPSDMQQLRSQFKPGLIPPFYYDLPETFEEIIESERKYLEAFSKNYFRTDCKYFTKALWNIIFKKARSR